MANLYNLDQPITPEQLERAIKLGRVFDHEWTRYFRPEDWVSQVWTPRGIRGNLAVYDGRHYDLRKRGILAPTMEGDILVHTSKGGTFNWRIHPVGHTSISIECNKCRRHLLWVLVGVQGTVKVDGYNLNHGLLERHYVYLLKMVDAIAGREAAADLFFKLLFLQEKKEESVVYTPSFSMN